MSFVGLPMTRTKCIVVTDIRTLANTPKSPEVSLDDFERPPCVVPRYAELEVVLDGLDLEEAA